MISIQDKLAQSRNRPSGFDYMRLVLSTGVIAQHTVNVSYGQQAVVALFHTEARAIFGLIIPMFFALSGFLVAGSLERNRSLISFLGLRAARLLPALALEIILSALVFGMFFTTEPISKYVSSAEFHSYFLNIFGMIHYNLPGVFLGNPDPRVVNLQLWTIPAELKCYLVLAGLGFFGIIGKKSLTIWIAILTQITLVVFAIRSGGNISMLAPIPVLVGCFLVGVCFYRVRSAIPISTTLGLLSFIATIVLLLVPYGDWLLPIPSAYLTIWLGTMNPKRNAILLSGDYSYGLYLYGFPIQQAVATLSWTHEWWINFVIAYPLAVLMAIFSWWSVERPALSLKKFIYLAEDLGLKNALIAWHSRKVFRMANAAQTT
jgi:peptidoglycan/LPS O-acetylase OafA/YrhL